LRDQPGSHRRGVSRHGRAPRDQSSRTDGHEGGGPMMEWTKDQLDKVARTEEVQIASARRDGMLGKPVTVWIVRHGDDLYLRSVRGPKGNWFRGTQDRHEGRIQAGGVQQDVAFVVADHDIHDEVDGGYRTNHPRCPGEFLK